MKKLLTASLLTLALTGMRVSAQTVLSLPDAIREAWTNRKNIQADALDSSISHLQTQALLKKYWPQLSIDYTYQYNPILQSSILPVGKFNPSLPPDATESVQFGTPWSQAAGLNLLQPLVDAGIKQQIRESRLQEKISGLSQQEAEYELAYEVAKAYINVWLQEQQIAADAIDSASSWESFLLQQERFRQKRLLKYDLNKALINHRNAVQKVRDAIVQLVENKIYLKFLIGRSVDSLADIETDSAFFQKGFAHWMQAPAEGDSIPEIRQLRMQQELSLLQQHGEKIKNLPTLSLKGFLGANQYSSALNPVAPGTWFGYSYLGLNARIPLLTGEDRQKKIKQLQLQSQQYALQSADKAAQYQQEAGTARLELSSLLSRLETLEQNMALERESVDLIRERVAAGQESASTLNLEELELQRMTAEYNSIREQGWRYWIDYMKASGLLARLCR